MRQGQHPALEPWGVRPLATGDTQQAIALLEQVEGGNHSRAYFDWRYQHSPTPLGVPNVWFADTGNYLVGQYAATPQPFQVGEERHHALQGLSAAVDPAFRQQPILDELASTAIDAWRRGDVPFVLHLEDGSQTKHGAIWQRLFQASWLWRPLRPAAYLRYHDYPGAFSAVAGVVGSIGNATLHGWMRLRGRQVQVEKPHRFNSAFDELWERLRQHYFALVVRDRRWLTYRYTRVPSIRYHILLARQRNDPTGYLVYRLTEHNGLKTGWIVDLLTAPSDQRSRSALLRHTISRLYREGAVAVRLLLPRHTALERWFRQVGFLRNRGASHVAMLPLRSDMPSPELQNPDLFYLMAGDFDVL